MSVLNSTVIEKCWLEGSNDFQTRIPSPTQQGYAQCVSELFAPYNHDLFNQFTGLLNGLMGTYIESKLFENPLRELKKPATAWGNTERGVAVKYLDAHSYMPTSETLLKVEKPEYREWFYSVQNPRRYEFSWSKYELQRVFAQGDSYAFDDLLSATLTQMYSSDNYDEMNSMIQMFAEADTRLGGLYRHTISAFPTNEATSKELLKAIRTDASLMKFPTMNFNHIDIPVHENGDTLVLWVSAQDGVLANLDVEALSQVFQLDKAEIQYRIIEIPSFPIPNVCAALTSEDFIYCRDVYYGVEPPFYNPENMTYKYYLQHAEMIGVNPVANCVLYSTDANTQVVPTIEIVPSKLAYAFRGNEVTEFSIPPVYGSMFKLPDLVLFGEVDGNEASSTLNMFMRPESATYTVTAKLITAGEDDLQVETPIALNSRTYVDKYGFLHLQKSGWPDVEVDVSTIVVTVTAKSTYANPSGSPIALNPAALDVFLDPTVDFSDASAMVERFPWITYSNWVDMALIDTANLTGVRIGGSKGVVDSN